MTASLEGGEWSATHSGHTLPPGKTRYSLYRRLVGPRAGLDGRKISSQPGFDPGPSSPKSVTVLTELPNPPRSLYSSLNSRLILVLCVPCFTSGPYILNIYLSPCTQSFHIHLSHSPCITPIHYCGFHHHFIYLNFNCFA